MLRFIIGLLLLLPFFASSQIDWAKLKKTSEETFAYRIPADSAEKYMKQDSIPVDRFLAQIPNYTFKIGLVDNDTMLKGHYVLICVIDHDIQAFVIEKSDLVIYPLMNEQLHVLEVRNKDGQFITDAQVWVNGKKTRFDARAGNYIIKKKKLEDEPLIKVCTNGDTSFVSFEKEGPRPSVTKQKWNFFKRTKIGYALTWLPTKIISILNGRGRSYQNNRIGARGYIVFNQPKYKLTDTVKLKAYIVNSKWKQYRKEVSVWLNYNAYGKNVSQLLANIKPNHAGSYVYEFPLNDTLVNDYSYNLEIKTKSGKKRVLVSNFRVEDYVLDDVTTYNFRSQKNNYFSGDSLVFFANAKDANDLPLLDAKAKLILLATKVTEHKQDSIYIADTLYQQEKSMLADGETKFILSSNFFPKADMDIKAILQFRNSNNEIQQRDVSLKYVVSGKELRVSVEKDSVVAEYFENGQSITTAGEMHVHGNNNISQTAQIRFPFQLKVDPLANRYDFYIKEKDSILVRASAYIEERYEPAFKMISIADTAGFVLSNPYRIPINYLLLDGNKVVTTGKSSEPFISWKNRINRRKKLFILKYGFVWDGRQQERSQNIGLAVKKLDIKIISSDKIFPGQKDSITIEVKDYKGRPVSNVNLTAGSYNAQLKKDIWIPEPPYLMKYKLRTNWRRGFYKMDNEEMGFSHKYPLGKHQQWRAKFGLDSLTYYQMLFPDKPLLDIATLSQDFMPQMNVHVVQQGKPQQAYMLYLNRQLVYYYGTTSQMPYSYQTNNYYTQIGIRLLDKYIEIDSVYVQPNYKHDFVLDLNNLPQNARVETMPKYHTYNEKTILNNSVFRLNNNQYAAFIWQGWRVASVPSSNYYYGTNSYLVGPFVANDSLHYFKPKHFDIHFKFEPGYMYTASNKVVRLERVDLFPRYYKDDKYYLPLNDKFSWLGLGDTLLAPPQIEYRQRPAEPFIKQTEYTVYNEFMPTKAGNGKLNFSVAKDTSLKYIALISGDTAQPSLIQYGSVRNINNIKPGNYQLLIVNKDWRIAIQSINIKADTSLYLHTDKWQYANDSIWIDSLEAISYPRQKNVTIVQGPQSIFYAEPTLVPIAKGNGSIHGKIMDEKGSKPIPGVSVRIKNSSTGMTTGNNGEFRISNIKAGTYTLLVAGIGYNSKQVTVEVKEGVVTTEYTIALSPSQQDLENVVVIGYSSMKRKDVTGSISTVSYQSMYGDVQYLMKSLPGVQVTDADGLRDSSTRILIRGGRSISASSPLYVIDGILYDEMPKDVSPDLIDKVDVLKDASASAIYGSRAANGVVIISTKTKTLRTQFRDYGFWKPELFTDKDGKVSFAVTYPDNITGWENFAIGMDKKRRVGKAIKFTKSFKPVMAQLSTPQFLIEGDKTFFTGKLFNYATDAYQLKTSFSLQNVLMNEKEMEVAANASDILPLFVETPSIDTLKASFQLKTTTGFKDGEERKIPVFKKGTEEAIGNFWILQNDTTVNFKAANNSSSIEVTALNSTLDMLLEEIDHLKKYPYYCMEQTASKLRGLVMEKQIKEALKQPFKNGKGAEPVTHETAKGTAF
jgi:TonB-dependent SusC/RagA subfamily outer membrane receptor